ncbi:MAG: hypothetical protein RLZZ370_951 [Bacteroidota bacterium]
MLLAGLSSQAFAQGLVQSGAHIVVTDGAFLVVAQAQGDYTARGDAKITLSANARFRIYGDWNNNGNTPVFTSNNGRVELWGFNQNIGGSNITAFPDLSLVGFGTKRLTQHTLVGGGYNKGGSGMLRLFGNTLDLQGNTLIINNRNPTAIMFSGAGGIISENPPGSGYSKVQWNIRDGVGGPVFTVPFVTRTGTRVPFVFTCNSLGVQTAADSGYFRVCTYPTSNVPVPNNRPLPTGVFHSENECQGENSQRLIDRFWVVEDAGYTTKPDATLAFTYAAAELTASNNTITESSVGAVKWMPATNSWNYPPKGTVNTTNNQVVYRAGTGFSGNWTISDTTPYPKAAFSITGTCESDSILFKDQSGIGATDKVASWQWNFGNGKLGSVQNPVAYYSPSGVYTARLIIRSESGCQDTVYKNLVIIPKPTAKFLVRDTCENADVKFESQSWPGAGFITGTYWDFGMGGPKVNAKQASYFYGGVGIPTVRLIVYNSNGCKDTAERNLFIAPKPYAQINFDNDCQYTPISFKNGSAAGGGTITSYKWDFGNKRFSTNPDETVSYAKHGSYLVKMSVLNSYGCGDTVVKPLTVYPRAIAKFDYTPEEPRMLEPIQFRNLSQYDSSWYWDFGDLFFDNVASPTHAYDMYGKYTVTLIANTPYGCDDTATASLIARSKPLYWFPNVFTPGSSAGMNDLFGLYTPSALQNAITNYNLIIYNLWGEIVFQSRDPKKLWDGTSGGKVCPQGAYVYRCTFNNPENEITAFSGDVTLVR